MFGSNDGKEVDSMWREFGLPKAYVINTFTHFKIGLTTMLVEAFGPDRDFTMSMREPSDCNVTLRDERELWVSGFCFRFFSLPFFRDLYPDRSLKNTRREILMSSPG